MHEESEVTSSQRSVSVLDIQRELQELKDLRKEIKASSPGKRMRAVNLEKQFFMNQRYKRQAVDLDQSLANKLDLYKLIYKNPNVKLNIPDTLVYMPEERATVYLKTNEKSIVQANDTESATDEFFANAESREISPKFIHLAMDGKIKVCNGSKEAREIFENCCYYKHRLQVFVHPFSKHVSKIRIKVKAQRIIESHILTAKLPIFPKRAQKAKNPGYLINNQPTQDYVQFKHVESCSLVVTKQTIGNLDAPIKTISSLIGKKANEFAVDCIRNANKDLVFLNIKHYGNSKRSFIRFSKSETSMLKMNNPKMKFINSVKKSNDNFLKNYLREQEELKKQAQKDNEHFEIQQVMNLIKFKAKNLKPSNESLESKDLYLQLKKADNKGRIPMNLNSFSFAHSSNAASSESINPLYRTMSSSKLTSKKIWTKSDYSQVEIMNKACRQFTNIKNSVVFSKSFNLNEREISQLMNREYENIKSACKVAFKKLLNDKMLHPFFDRRNHEDQESLAGHFVKCLHSKVTWTSKRLKIIHQRMKINQKHLQRFYEVLKESFRDHGVCERDILTIFDRLKYFEEAIIDNYN